MVRLSSCNTEELTSVVRGIQRFQTESSEASTTPVAPKEEASTYRLVSGNEAVQIIKLYQTGLTAAEVGKRIGRPPRTITDVLRRHGVEVQHRVQQADVDLAEMTRLYSSGMSLAKVAKVLGVGRSTVGKYLGLAGVPLRSKSEAATLHHQQEGNQEQN